MKKVLLLGLNAAIGIGALGALKVPDVIPEFYSYKISADGKYIISRTEAGVEILDTESGDLTDFGDFDPGEGNCISADGSVIVGSDLDDNPVLFINGKQIFLEDYKQDHGFATLSFNGVTSDGKRIVGFVTNPENTETMTVPMYIDINDDGTLGEVNYLPYPRKDWLGEAPVYVYCMSVSADGKIISGQLKDNSGFTVVPVIFRQDSDGKWAYTLPTESLINPNKLPIPTFPEPLTQSAPDYADYMTAEELAAYQAAMDAWEASGFQQDLFPTETDFMTDEQAAAYSKAVAEYEQAAEEYNARFEAYFVERDNIISQSVFFMQNGQTMDAAGTRLAMAAEIEDVINPDPEFPEVDVKYPLYVYDIESGELTDLGGTSDGMWVVPDQILSDGSIIANTPLPGYFSSEQIPPLSYVVAPGSTEFTPLDVYMEKFNPEGAAWLRKEFQKNVLVAIDYDTMEEKYMDLVMTGHPVVSDDWSVVSGGVLAYYYSEAYSYESYVIYSDPFSGIGQISSDSRLVEKKYYDLNGIEVKNPAKGIYIERGVYSDGRVETVKKAVM